MSEVISSFRSLRAGSQVFALLMLFLCVVFQCGRVRAGRCCTSYPLVYCVCLVIRMMFVKILLALYMLVECAFTSPVRTECAMF